MAVTVEDLEQYRPAVLRILSPVWGRKRVKHAFELVLFKFQTHPELLLPLRQPVLSYLMKCVQNLLIDRVRQEEGPTARYIPALTFVGRTGTPVSLIENLPDPRMDPAAICELRDSIQRWWKLASPEERMIVARRWEGLTLRESELIGLSTRL